MNITDRRARYALARECLFAILSNPTFDIYNPRFTPFELATEAFNYGNAFLDTAKELLPRDKSAQ